MKRTETVRMFCILVGSALAAFLVPLAARARLASPRPVEAPVMAALWEDTFVEVSGNQNGMHLYPALAVRDEYVYAMWSKLVTGSEEYDPYYNWSDHYGHPDSGWMNDRVRIQQTIPPYDTVNVDMAADSTGGLHFVWAEATGTPNYTLYYSYTHAAGIQEIAHTDKPGMVPAIAVSNDRVHVVWSQGSQDITYTNKTIDPGDWSSSSPTTVRSSPNPLANPAIAVSSNGIVHVAWNEGGGSESKILYKNNSNWSGNPITVSHNVAIGSHGPALAVSGDNVYAVWCEHEKRDTQYIRFGQSTNGGSNWNNSTRIPGDALAANSVAPTYLRPDIAVDSSGKLHVVFNGSTSGESGYEEIFYVSSSNGASWSSRRNISEKPNANSTTPAVAVSGDFIHVIWAETTTAGNYEVLYRRGSPQAEGVYLPIITKY